MATLTYTIRRETHFLSRHTVTASPNTGHHAPYVMSSGPRNMQISLGSQSGPIVGNIHFHSFGSHIDIVLNNSGLRSQIRKDGLWSRSWGVNIGGLQLLWKHTSQRGHHGRKVVDQSDNMYALVDGSMFSSGRSLEIVAPGLRPEMVEGIVISAVALLEEEKRRSNSAAAAGAGG